jgi:hypothetical protein
MITFIAIPVSRNIIENLHIWGRRETGAASYMGKSMARRQVPIFWREPAT